MTEAKHFFTRAFWKYDPEYKHRKSQDNNIGFETRSLHAGFRTEETKRKLSSFSPKSVNANSFDEIPYLLDGKAQLSANSILEERLASLEGGEACLTTVSSPLALFNLIVTIALPGDNIIISSSSLGEGHKQAATIYSERYGIHFRAVEKPENPRHWGEAIDSNTKLVLLETPSPPSLFIADIEAICDLAHSKDVPVAVDNSFATSALQKPMDLGADMVLLSIPKFFPGITSAFGGALIGPEALIEDIRWNTAAHIGANMQPNEAWMALHYLETLSLRMEKQSSNTQKVADFLVQHPNVEQVNYSGLPRHPQHELASFQMKHHGALLSFIVKNGAIGAKTVLKHVKLIEQSATFGLNRTTCMPPTIIREQLTPQEQQVAKINDGLIRLSVGLETPKDLLADLDQALEKLS